MNQIETELLNNYLVTEEIGSGSFGEVYLAEHVDGGFVAIKVEDKRKTHRIREEYKIYRYLTKNNFIIGIPKVHEFLQSTDFNIMVMQLLGPNLEELFNTYGNKLQLGTVFLLAMQILSLLENLHKLKFIHRDIKPSNFLISRDSGVEQIYIMDFGLAKKYINHGKHINFRDKLSLIGTVRYASNNIHMGFEPSRRDDLESLGYMLIYFLKGKLPWQGIKKHLKENYMEKVGEIKMCTPLNKLCEGLPDCLLKYMIYCRKLKFTQDPDYEYLKMLFIEGTKELRINPSYEWRE